MKYIASLFLVGLLFTNGYGQDTLSISGTMVKEKLRSENLQLKISEKAYDGARADYQQSNALFLPSVSVSHTAMFTNNPLMAFGSKLNQEILTQNDFNPALLNDPDEVQNYATKVEVLQPIINVDGIYERKAAKAKMNAFELQSGRTQEYLEFEAEKAYMQLQLAYKAVAVLEKAQQTAEANLKLITDYYNQGLVKQTDVLSVKVRVNEVKNQLQYAKSNVQNASDYLSFLMGEDTVVVYKPETELEGVIEVEDPQNTVPESRKDIMAMEASANAYKSMMKSGNMSLLPRLNAFGSYELYDDEVFQMGAKGYTFGAQLSWDLFDGYKSIGKAKKAKYDYEKASLELEQYKAKSELELHKTTRQLNDAENNVQLAKEALEQSKEAYRILHNRFEEGLEKTTDLLNTETQMYQKELAYLQSVFQYNTTKSYVQFLTR
ncbi:TolC family protein [Neptunitalea lumnitzerae]|uniref:Transporter n=1 Tax=Neptunitalea lumnitzerae TaxID=2965509 RepID=A0ABQ5MGT8_9FLAO|nr:TolC family protein [Neptunitalea sp. Y10]GLB48631.1 transporter [Neptunitalea sp. Y10]